MSEDRVIGDCPFCRKNTQFRKLSFSENLGTVGDFLGGAFFGGTAKKRQSAKTIFNEATETRAFPNYICESCGAKVMKCSCCKEIIPYQHDGSSHQCLTDMDVTLEHPNNLIEQLERLGVLREKGILTEEEFIQQKNKLLGQG
ncbi:SHOCT domain-containing protein [Vibrio alginolyticus]